VAAATDWSKYAGALFDRDPTRGAASFEFKGAALALFWFSGDGDTGGTFSSQLSGTKRSRQIPQVERHESVVNNLEQRIGLSDFLAY